MLKGINAMTAIKLILLLWMCSLTQLAFAQNHLQFVAQSGDGIFAILRKYDLEKANCNLQYFFKINDLRNNDHLLKGLVYKLPVLIYEYNGTSIRSTIGNNNMDLAEKIEAYNLRMVKAGFKNQNYTQNKELWVPHSYLECEYRDIIQPTLTKGMFPIFGEKYANITQIDNSLSGRVYYIVSGHGGPDPGAVCQIDNKTVSEDEYAYDIALRLARNLIMRGATAYMITRDPNDGIRDEEYLECDNDEQCWENQSIPLNQLARLRQRANAINKLYAKHKKEGKKQLVITIHIDSRQQNKRVDMFFYHHPKSSEGKEVATILHSTIMEKYNFYNPWRGYDGDVSARDLYMLRETHPTSVYLELGNIQNPKDQDRFIIVSNRQAVADWITDGLKKIK